MELDRIHLEELLEDGNLQEPIAEAIFYGEIKGREGFYFVHKTIIQACGPDAVLETARRDVLNEDAINLLWHEATKQGFNIFRNDRPLDISEINRVAEKFGETYAYHYRNLTEEHAMQRRADMHVIGGKNASPVTYSALRRMNRR